MTEITADKSTHFSPAHDDLIAGKKLRFYWQNTRLLIIAIFAVEAIIAVLDQFEFLTWVVEVIAFFILAYFLARKHKAKINTTLFASGYAGVLAGFIVAIFQLIWYREWLYALNLIRLPFIYCVLGIVVSFVSYLLLQGFISKKKININNK